MGERGRVSEVSRERSSSVMQVQQQTSQENAGAEMAHESCPALSKNGQTFMPLS